MTEDIIFIIIIEEIEIFILNLKLNKIYITYI